MPRAVWTGSLSFGLVSIPVALYPATEPKDVRFHLFDRQGRRVRYRRFAEETDLGDRRQAEGTRGEPSTVEDVTPPDEGRGERGGEARAGTSGGRELEYDELVRGYEVEPGRFAMLEHEEIAQVRPSRSATIELEDFVELESIDPV